MSESLLVTARPVTWVHPSPSCYLKLDSYARSNCCKCWDILDYPAAPPDKFHHFVEFLMENHWHFYHWRELQTQRGGSVIAWQTHLLSQQVNVTWDLAFNNAMMCAVGILKKDPCLLRIGLPILFSSAEGFGNTICDCVTSCVGTFVDISSLMTENCNNNSTSILANLWFCACPNHVTTDQYLARDCKHREIYPPTCIIKPTSPYRVRSLFHVWQQKGLHCFKQSWPHRIR